MPKGIPGEPPGLQWPPFSGNDSWAPRLVAGQGEPRKEMALGAIIGSCSPAAPEVAASLPQVNLVHFIPPLPPPKYSVSFSPSNVAPPPSLTCTPKLWEGSGA